MKNLGKCCLLIILLVSSCGNPGNRDSRAENNKNDTETTSYADAKNQVVANPQKNEIQINKPGTPKKETKSVEVEIKKLNPADSIHKMSVFQSDRTFFHKDSLYCEVLYKLKEVQILTGEHSPDGDYISMMIDERPEGKSQFYQIAVCRIRVRLDKMDRLETYRIDVKTRQIEKHDVVKDKWIKVRQ